MDGASEMIVSTRSALIGVDTAPVSLLYVMDRPVVDIARRIRQSIAAIGIAQASNLSEDVSAA